MLRYFALGSQILLAIFVALAGLALYLPFLEGFALTPAIAFVHRFSITINLGSDTKTIQPIIFVVPILFVKGLLEYHKRYGIKSLLTSKLALIVSLLVGADLISLLTSVSRGAALGTFIVHGINLMLFLTTCFWLRIVYDMMSKPQLQKIGLKILTTFAITLAAFTITNTVVSATQFLDCSRATDRCSVWNTIDAFFPNKLLPVGHQKFSYQPVVIRAPGFFGDVNFNGMFSLIIVFITGTLLLVSGLLTAKKGYEPIKERRFLLITFVAASLSFLLTISRSALVGLGVTGAVFGIAIFWPLFKQIGASKTFSQSIVKAAVIAIVGIILLFAAGFAVPLSYQGKQTSVSSEIVTYIKKVVSPEDDSAQGHVELFQSAVIIGNQNPLFGMGMGTFSEQYAKVIDSGNTNANPHSTYGTLYAEQGLIGLIIYTGVIIFFWYTAIIFGKKQVEHVVTEYKKEKRLSKEFYLESIARLTLVLIGFGIPFMSIATITYYGFFLPMTWWWGSAALLNEK